MNMLSAIRNCWVLATMVVIVASPKGEAGGGGGGGGNFNKEVDITWGDGHANILNNGTLLTLSLDQDIGSGFRSKNEYLYGRIDMKLKLVPGNSAGTVTTYYLSSEGEKHDEIDFEFLGNVSGEPYIVHTNIYIDGQGNREQQFYVWFDPTSKFHTYSLLWNPLAIIFYIDSTPIRVFKNMKAQGLPFPETQPMRVYGSIWDAEDWATQGGRIKTNWTEAPFTAAFTGLGESSACVWSSTTSSTPCNITTESATVKQHRRRQRWLSQELDSPAQEKLKWVRQNYMVYDYCLDVNRFPLGLPSECTIST